MAKTAILKVDIISDARRANQGFDQAANRVSAFEKGLAGANRAAMAVGAGLVAVGVQAVKAASDAQQAAGAVESVFKGNATQVKRFAENAAQAVGLSESAYNNFAARVGSQFKNLGVPMDQLADKTNDLIERASDLAATFGGTTADAVDALSAAFRGEFDPIERYGISIRKSDINARLAAKGLDKLEGAALKAAEAQEISAMIAEQSADAHGQFAREADTAAGQYQRLTAEWENAKAELGEALLPLLTDLAKELSKVARWVSDNKDAVTRWAKVLGTAAAAIIGINGAIKTYKAVTKGIKTLKALFGLGNVAAMSGEAAGVAAAHSAAATATGTAWTTAGTTSTAAVTGFSAAAAIEAVVVSGALIGAAIAIAGAWAERTGEMGDGLGEFSETATGIADDVRAAWADVFTGAANALSWAAWNARVLSDTLTAQLPTVQVWAGLWTAGGDAASAAVGRLALNLTLATAAASVFGITGAIALAQIAAGLGMVSILGAPVIAMLNNAAIASQVWGSIFAGVAAGIAAGLSTVVGWVSRVIESVGRAIGPTGRLGNVGQLAGALISGAMSAAAGVINGLAGAAYRVIGALQSVISWARSAAAAVAGVGGGGFFDGGLLGGRADPDFAGVAGTPTHFLPPASVFAAAASGSLGSIGSRAGRPAAVDARTFITVEGALDPVAVADQIRSVLGNTDRTRGVIPAMRLGT